MPVNLSYINSAGEEIILDDGESGFMREVRGRSGMEAPSIGLTTIEYADGSSQIISSMFKPRSITCYFWAERVDPLTFETTLDNMKMKMIETGTQTEWGKLKLRKLDGSYVTINCAYSGGYDQIVRDEESRIAFSLSFQSTDSLFFDLNETQYTIKKNTGTGLLMRTGLVMADDLFMAGSNMQPNFTVNVKCQRSYPKIVITGYAETIKVTNNTTGKIIQMNPSFRLLTGETLTIYTESKKRKVVYTNRFGGDVIATPQLTAQSTLDWSLERGDNSISVIITQQQISTTCNFYYRQGWLSV